MLRSFTLIQFKPETELLRLYLMNIRDLESFRFRTTRKSSQELRFTPDQKADHTMIWQPVHLAFMGPTRFPPCFSQCGLMRAQPWD